MNDKFDISVFIKIRNMLIAVRNSLVACQAHKLKVLVSNPSHSTNKIFVWQNF